MKGYKRSSWPARQQFAVRQKRCVGVFVVILEVRPSVFTSQGKQGSYFSSSRVSNRFFGPVRQTKKMGRCSEVLAHVRSLRTYLRHRCSGIAFQIICTVDITFPLVFIQIFQCCSAPSGTCDPCDEDVWRHPMTRYHIIICFWIQSFFKLFRR